MSLFSWLAPLKRQLVGRTVSRKRRPASTRLRIELLEDRWNPAPVISALSLDFGPVAGGTSVEIIGTGFLDAAQVTFGNADAVFTIQGDTSILATSPANPAGAVQVSVFDGLGDTGGTLGGPEFSTFTYYAAPTITDFTPTTGAAGGGTFVSITGTNLSSATKVEFGSVEGTIIFADETVIDVFTPPAPSLAAVVNITVTTLGGSATATSQYAYEGLPAAAPS
jgi:hypothetical protein